MSKKFWTLQISQGLKDDAERTFGELFQNTNIVLSYPQISGLKFKFE